MYHMKSMDFKLRSNTDNSGNGRAVDQTDRFGFLRKNVRSSQNSHKSFQNQNGYNTPPSYHPQDINQFAALSLDRKPNQGFSHMHAQIGQLQNHTPIDLTSEVQIQEAKPGNKRAILVDLPGYLYSIPALAGFFEPYGEVAMLQILPQKRMWDGDLIDLLGATMCNRLARKSLCAVVEFHSARMAKFIIGILRKRLPTLKFRCALLKPSAGIELTNQADNLGLVNAVRIKTKRDSISSTEKTTSDSSSQEHPIHCGHSSTSESSSQLISSLSGEESGLEEMSSNSGSTSNQVINTALIAADNSSVTSLPSYTTDSDDSNASTNNDDKQRFVSSFKIVLN